MEQYTLNWLNGGGSSARPQADDLRPLVDDDSCPAKSVRSKAITANE